MLALEGVERVQLKNIQSFNPEEIAKNKEFLEKYRFSKFESDKIGAQYDDYVDDYDHFLRNAIGYADPDVMAIAFEDLKVPLDAKILDVASGSGLLAISLAKKGYKFFDGIDASQKMIDKATTFNLYQHQELMYLGNGDLPEKFRDSYDCVIQAGSFLPGHLPTQTIDQMVQSLKIGGLMFMSIREKIFVELGHWDRMKKLMDEGKIKMVKQFWWIKYEGVNESQVGGSDFFHPEDASCSVYMRLK